jgi:type II secretory pathway pseudopilin PulG
MKRNKGWTLIELIIGIGFLFTLALTVGLIWIALHFVLKFW